MKQIVGVRCQHLGVQVEQGTFFGVGGVGGEGWGVAPETYEIQPRPETGRRGSCRAENFSARRYTSYDAFPMQ